MRFAWARGAALACFLLAGLPGRLAAADVPAGAVLAELPFLKPERTNRIVVDLAAEGSKSFPLMLDTGAAATVITPGMARQLGVLVRRTKRTPYRRATLLGRDLQFWIDADWSDVASKTGWEYGLLGGEFLARYVVEIDFGRRRVRFLDPDRYQVPKAVSAPDETVLPLRTPSNRPHAEIVLNGQRIRALVDTGDPFPASLAGRTARRLGIEPVQLAGLEVWSVGGPLSGAALGEARRLTLGSLGLEHVPLVTTRGDYNQGDASGVALGYDVLSHFVVRIDYPRRRMWLRRIPEVRMTFLGMDYRLGRRGGLLAASDGAALSVEYVIEGSPAWRHGLRPGDRIESAEPDASSPEFEPLVARIVAGDPIHVLRAGPGGWARIRLPQRASSPTSGPQD